ncbi:MAG: DNA recombination protein RmuC, partial [Clostridia bacterium]|nr:DNA recombination protein RmuC [Clostridia bacterium]
RLQDASQSGDAAAVDAARKALMQQIKLEARRISGKYIAPPHTTDFAVMFLPVEGLYAEVVQQTDLVDAIQREQRVVIAGPSTFSALLNALQMGFRTLAIEKRSGEVWKLLGTVKADFGAFSDVLEKTQLRLRQASESIDSAFVKTRTIQRHLGQVESAGKDGALPAGEQEDA